MKAANNRLGFCESRRDLWKIYLYIPLHCATATQKQEDDPATRTQHQIPQEAASPMPWDGSIWSSFLDKWAPFKMGCDSIDPNGVNCNPKSMRLSGYTPE